MPSDVIGTPLARSAFAVPDEVAYLDTAFASPLPIAAAEAVAADARAASVLGSTALDERFARLDRLRSTWAALVGAASADDIALVANTTQGLGIVAAGLDWRPGDVVLVAEGDHPTTVLPWRAQAHRGASVVEVPLASLPAAVATTPRVRVVAVSWVQAHDGTRTDLAALAAVAHDAGALLCVDLIQGAGVVPCALDAWGVDAAAGGSQKWLLGPHGIGFAHLAPHLREWLAPTTLSKGSLAAGGTAARFEAGAPNHAGVAGALASATLLAEAGVEAIWGWVDARAGELRAGAEAAGLDVVSPGGDARSALVTLTVPGLDGEAVRSRLADAGVVASARGVGVRLSPAGWTSEGDVDRALAALRRL